MLEREENGIGKIWYTKSKKNIEFKIPLDELMSTRQDSL